MKIKIAASSEAFPHFECGSEIEAKISFLEDKMHELIVGDKKYILEVVEFKFINNQTILISCFITDNESVGRISLAFEYAE